MNLKITFLGTGTSQGVPVIACQCHVCVSTNPQDKRLRTSVLIETGDQNIVIDSGPDFRCQMLRSGLRRLDAVLFTHQHRDHIAGLDDVRSFNYLQQKAMPLYGNSLVMEQIRMEFHYAFENKYPGIPKLELHEIANEAFMIDGLSILPIEVLHHQLPVFGYRIGDFTYITDANIIPKKEMKKMVGTKTLVLNALQKDGHISHFNLQEALEVIDIIKPEKAYLTHIGHKMGKHIEVSAELPPNVQLAYDSLTIYS